MRIKMTVLQHTVRTCRRKFWIGGIAMVLACWLTGCGSGEPGEAPAGRGDGGGQVLAAQETHAPAKGGAQMPARIEVTPEELDMANEIIEANTMKLPGFMPGSTMESGPGPLNDVDQVVLLALKMRQKVGGLVPYEDFAPVLQKIEGSDWNKNAAAKFWAWYREVTLKADEPWTVREGFESYIQMKYTAKMRLQNRQLEANVAAEEAWRRAVESQRQFNEGIAAREEKGRLDREFYLQKWDLEWQAAQEAYKIWRDSLPWGN